MNFAPARPISIICYSMLISVLVFLVACQPSSAPQNTKAIPNQSASSNAPSNQVNDKADSQSSPGKITSLQALKSFKDLLRSEILAEDNVWTVAHGLLAFSEDFDVTTSPFTEIEQKLRAHAESDEAGSYYLYLHEGTASGRDLGEAHPHLVLKTLIELELLPDLSLELMRRAVEKWKMPTDAEGVNDSAWLIDAWARQMKLQFPKEDNPQVKWASYLLGEYEKSDAIVERTLKKYEQTKKFVRPGGQSSPEVAGTWGFTCSGQHLFQSLILCVQQGWLGSKDLARVQKRLSVFLKQIRAEYEFREQEYKRAVAAHVSPRKARSMTTIAELKLLGHALETMARARDAGLMPQEELLPHAKWARDKLLLCIQLACQDLDLAKLLPKLRKVNPYRWQRYFGDGCHAIRGLNLWPELSP